MHIYFLVKCMLIHIIEQLFLESRAPGINGHNVILLGKDELSLTLAS